MNNNHIQRGLLFVTVCLLIGMGIAFMMIPRNNAAMANGTETADNAASPTFTADQSADAGGAGDGQAATTDPQAALAAARSDNLMAAQSIGAAWQALSADLRAQLLPVQRAWIKQKDADCRAEAASMPADPTAMEIRRLQCEKRVTDERLAWLSQYGPTPEPAAGVDGSGGNDAGPQL